MYRARRGAAVPESVYTSQPQELGRNLGGGFVGAAHDRLGGYGRSVKGDQVTVGYEPVQYCTRTVPQHCTQLSLIRINLSRL